MVGEFLQEGGITSINGGSFNVEGTFQQNGGQIVVSQGTVNLEENALLNGGSFTLDLGTLNLNNTLEVATGALLTTSGTINGNVTNFGTLELLSGQLFGNLINQGIANLGWLADPAAGNVFSIAGAFSQGSYGRLVMDVAREDGDYLQVSGNVSLAGTLEIHWADSYPPEPEDSWGLLAYGSRSGIFDSYLFPPGDWEARYDDPNYPNSLSLWYHE